MTAVLFSDVTNYRLYIHRNVTAFRSQLGVDVEIQLNEVSLKFYKPLLDGLHAFSFLKFVRCRKSNDSLRQLAVRLIEIR